MAMKELDSALQALRADVEELNRRAGSSSELARRIVANFGELDRLAKAGHLPEDWRTRSQMAAALRGRAEGQRVAARRALDRHAPAEVPPQRQPGASGR